MEFASGLVAAPASPNPPPRASGAINRKGTAVVMVFNLSVSSIPDIWPVPLTCAIEFNDKKTILQENIDRLQKMKYELFNKNNKSYYVSLGLLSYNNKEIIEDTWNKIK